MSEHTYLMGIETAARWHDEQAVMHRDLAAIALEEAEASARWHEKEAVMHRELAASIRKSPVKALEHEADALRHENHAKMIRRLAAATPNG